MAKRETVDFNGVRFYRYPESKNRSHTIYFQPHVHARRKGVQSLHVEIWKAAHGPLPEGMEVHHKDGNPDNNDLDNLDLISRSEHARLHARERARSPERLAQLKRASQSPARLAWMQSAEGKAKMRENARKSMSRLPLLTRNCDFCGVEYRYKLARSRFCSDRCALRQRTGVKLHREARPCVTCGKLFDAMANLGAKYCSHTCRARLARGVVKESRACERCGEPFATFRKRQKFCGESCRRAATAERVHPRL